jgi:hypothetical protein
MKVKLKWKRRVTVWSVHEDDARDVVSGADKRDIMAMLGMNCWHVIKDPLYTARGRVFRLEWVCFFDWSVPVRIRVRIDPPHPLECRKRRLNGAVLRMRPEKPRSRVTAGVAR